MNPYEKFEKTELILRDELAIDRTLLANERTLLAYLRSGVALLITGISIIHFSQESWFHVVGFICIPCAVAVSVAGWLRFRKMGKGISIVRKQLKKTEAESSANPSADNGA